MDSNPNTSEANSLLPAIRISSGTMEAVKWFALLAMTVDHINRFFFNTSIYPAYCIGRLAMPLFAFIFAYNLAQPKALEKGIYARVLKRLFLFGLLATPPYISMRQLTGLFPLNIMIMLAIAAVTLFCYEKMESKKNPLAILIFLVGGFFVEYTWSGIFFCLASWCYCKRPSIISLLACLIAYLFLDQLNGNHWALLTLPLIFLASKIDLKLPRTPYVFYIYYPLHLYLLFLLSRYMLR